MSPARRTGSVVCPGCGRLVGAGERSCPFCGRAAPAMFGLTAALRRVGLRLGLWQLVLGGCAVLYVAALVVDPRGLAGPQGGLLGFLAPTGESLLAFGASGPVPVLGMGRWWTVLSAGWLHANLLHIVMNLLWVRQLAPAVEQIYGSGRAMVIYTLSGVAGFLASSVSPVLPKVVQMVMGSGSLSVGASAPLFGLLGALVHFSRRGGARELGQQVWTWAIAMFAFGLLFPGIDNWAHLGGFAGGYLLSLVLDPLKQERLDHLIAGIVCLAASAAAIAWSLISSLR